MRRHADTTQEYAGTITLTLGDGTQVTVLGIEVKDRQNGREIDAHLPDLSHHAPCSRCGGAPGPQANIVDGGLLPHLELKDGRWHDASRPCPACIFGAYRKMISPAVKFHDTFRECSASDLGFLIRLLKNPNPAVGRERAVTLREAVDSLKEPEVDYGPKAGRDPDFYLNLYERLERGVFAIEQAEQHNPAPSAITGEAWSEEEEDEDADSF